MYCSKCGSKNKEETKFCTHCGSELIPSNNSQIQSTSAESKYGTISLLLGLISLVLSPFLNIITIPFAIIGIIFGVKSKQISGKILSIISIIISVIIFLVLCSLFLKVFIKVFSQADYRSTYKCGDYTDNMNVQDIQGNIDFELRKDKSFTLKYTYPDGEGLIEGTYEASDGTYDPELSTFTYDLDLNATSRMIDNEQVEGQYTTKYSLVIVEDNEIF